jgi:hypothetical protein
MARNTRPRRLAACTAPPPKNGRRSQGSDTQLTHAAVTCRKVPEPTGLGWVAALWLVDLRFVNFRERHAALHQPGGPWSSLENPKGEERKKKVCNHV